MTMGEMTADALRPDLGTPDAAMPSRVNVAAPSRDSQAKVTHLPGRSAVEPEEQGAHGQQQHRLHGRRRRPEYLAEEEAPFGIGVPASR
jgi:hypothetical protein